MHSSKRPNRRIKDMPASQRPREKLINRGGETLSEAELIALLIGSGSNKKNAVQIAKRLLKKHTLVGLSQMSPNKLTKIPGIGDAKAARLKAAFELGERTYATRPLDKTVVSTSQDVIGLVKEITTKRQEYLVVLYLNARYELLQKETIGLGTLNTLNIEPKEIFSPALNIPCAFVILAHNHPSKDVTPSEDDLKFTQRITAGGKIMGINLIDHIIVCHDGYFSFRENDIIVKLSEPRKVQV